MKIESKEKLAKLAINLKDVELAVVVKEVVVWDMFINYITFSIKF